MDGLSDLVMSPHFVLFFCANFVHSTITWLIVCSLSPHSWHMGGTSSLSIVFLMLLVRTAWSYAAVRSPSVSFFMVPLFNQSHKSGSFASSVPFRNWPCNALFLYLVNLSAFILCFVTPLSKIFSSVTAWSYFVTTHLNKLPTSIFTQSSTLNKPRPPYDLFT